jgi:2-amino-4-hydroxy-6-hydroxymethyldihydropteridine diphosphokinase
VILLGLGGNVGGDEAIVARFEAVAAAFAAWGPVRGSRIYRTAPIGPAQDDFLNAAISVRAAPEPQPDELAAMIRETERLLGRDREREVRWGPRPIDIDVLVWGDRVLRSPLEVPHPRLADRKFALAPLADLLGEDAVVPGAGRLGDLLRAVRDQVVRETALVLRTSA